MDKLLSGTSLHKITLMSEILWKKLLGLKKKNEIISIFAELIFLTWQKKLSFTETILAASNIFPIPFSFHFIFIKESLEKCKNHYEL